MRTLTRERILTDPHRTLTQTPACDVPGAILLDQTGAHPVHVTALNALDTPDTAFAAPSPYRNGITLLGAANSDRDREGLPPTFTSGGHLYAGPCVIVTYNDATGDTLALTLDEIFYVLRHVYIVSSYGAPDANVVWMVDLGEVPDV